MKRLIVFTATAFCALTVHAQNPADMSEADMQKMMQGAQAMQTCMQNVDQTAMQRLQTESEQLSADIKTLCAAGKRDEAQSKVLAFGMKTAKDPAMKAMAECGKQMQGMVPQMQNMHQMPYADAEHEYANRHVCDTQ